MAGAASQTSDRILLVAIPALRNDDWAISSPLHNKLAPQDRAIHAWYRFVLSFPPHLVRQYVREFGLDSRSCLLDPFCGTGTTVVEAKKLGIASVGIEANPMAVLASQVKVTWDVDPGTFLREAEIVAKEAALSLPPLQSDPLFAAVKERLNLYNLRCLEEEQEQLILTGSVSPLPLHRVLTLLKLIDEAAADLRDHFRLALAWTLVNDAGNIRFGPEVGITKAKTDVDVVGSWLGQVIRMAHDLAIFRPMGAASSRVIHGDSRLARSEIAPGSIDAVITSPPYPNEKDYTRTTRLESVILGLIRTKSDLRNLKQNLIRSNTRNVYVADEDHLHVEDIPEIQRIAAEIESRRIEMGKTSGFERLYHRVTKLYFGGMAKHLRELAPLLKPGAHLAYVVGDQASYLRIMIRTGELLEEVALQEGYEVVRRDLFRTRWATATKAQLREEVVVLRWPGQ